MKRRPAARIAVASLFSCLCVGSLAARAIAAPAATAEAQLKQSNERIEKLLEQKKGAADLDAVKRQITEVVGGLLDYDELARRSLANHWSEIDDAQKKEFVSTLRELIEKNYSKQLETNLDYDVAYKGEETSGKDATVRTVVKVRTKGKSTDTAIDYKMHKAGTDNRWMVYDVITDEVSMVKNYKQQFNKVITQEKFAGLLAKMRKKIKATNDAPASANAGHE